MEKFMKRFGSQVDGVVSGWDRIAIRGSSRWLSSVRGLSTYLSGCPYEYRRFGPGGLSRLVIDKEEPTKGSFPWRAAKRSRNSCCYSKVKRLVFTGTNVGSTDASGDPGAVSVLPALSVATV